jgi:twinkle protein
MTVPETQSNFVKHTPCPNCGSQDANAEYDDGHSFCFSCETHTQAEKHGSVASPATSTSTKNHSEQEKALLTGEAKAIPARGLTEETCRKYGYFTGSYQGQPVQVATYRDKNGKPTAQKLRFKDKRFQIVGNAKAMTLFGSHLWGKKSRQSDNYRG